MDSKMGQHMIEKANAVEISCRQSHPNPAGSRFVFRLFDVIFLRSHIVLH